MKINWIPDGEEADYDPVEDVGNMIKSVDEFNDGVDKKLEEFDANVKEFNDIAAELEAEWFVYVIISIYYILFLMRNTINSIIKTM